MSTAIAVAKSTSRAGVFERASGGSVFLDELGEFPPAAIEALRQPLEEGRVTISRAAHSTTFPADFVLVAAMNPCPCGLDGAGTAAACTCTPMQRRRYLARISGPLADRVDLQVSLLRPTLADLEFGASSAEPTSVVAARVAAARERMASRLAGTPWRVNSDVPGPVMRRQFGLSVDAGSPLDAAVARGSVSARGADRVVRVAWTLADLAGRDRPSRADVGGALIYRDAGLSWAA